MISTGPSLLRLADFTNGYPFKPDDLNGSATPVIRIRQLLDSSAEVDYTDLTIPEVRIENGDLIFSWSATLAAVRWDRGSAYLNQHLFRVDPIESVDRRWLEYVIHVACDMLKPLMHGSAMTHVTRDMLRRVRVAKPTLAKQLAVADFLDAETARIDALVAKKRLLLAAAEERLSTSISVLTCAEACASPITAGGIPSGWSTPFLRRCFTEVDYGIGDATASHGKFPVLGMGNVDDRGSIVGPPGGYVPSVDESLILRSGDLLFNRTNSLAKVGKVGLVKELDVPTTFASYLVRLRANKLAEPQYLNYALNAREFLEVARAAALPSIGQANLSPARYGGLKIALPPLRVQVEISNRLDEERAHVDALRAMLDCQIGALQEHRRALITAAVTGQIDIPGG